jgi:hypothetical protein
MFRHGRFPSSSPFFGLVSFMALAGCGSSSGGSATMDSGNLIVNGNAEAAPGSTNASPVKTPGWTSTGGASAIQYGTSEYPSSTDPGPPDRGKNFFFGGEDDPMGTLTQTTDVSQYATSIDAGQVTYVLSGWLGGYSSQGDNATLTVTFEGASNRALGKGSIGPVTTAERMGETELLEKSAKGPVPTGTRSVRIVLTMVRLDGTSNDGYADDLSLVFDNI